MGSGGGEIAWKSRAGGLVDLSPYARLCKKKRGLEEYSRWREDGIAPTQLVVAKEQGEGKEEERSPAGVPCDVHVRVLRKGEGSKGEGRESSRFFGNCSLFPGVTCSPVGGSCSEYVG